jgi:flagellin-like hook-associated protein FlgL
MSSVPSVFSRVPNALSSQLLLGSISRTNNQLIQLQVQLASGKALNRPSDNPIGASTVGVIDNMLERRDQILRNLSQADSMLGTLDATMQDAGDLLLEARSVGLSQMGVDSDPQTRRNEAEVINSILQSMEGLANRDYRGIHLFAGSATGSSPFTGLLGGYQYNGSGNGLVTDIGLGDNTPVTISGEEAFGGLSARVEGHRDLDPDLLPETRLSDLDGARGLGITRGSVSVNVNGVETQVDLSDASTIEDVYTRIEAAIQATDPGASVEIDPINSAGFRISLSVGTNVTISDPQVGVTAQDLGIAGTYAGGTSTAGGDLNPGLTWITPVDSLTGVTTPLGTIRVENGSQSRDVDLSGAETIQDIRNAIEQLNLGVRVEISESGDRISVHNEVSGLQMSIGEVGGGTTATELGIRSFDSETQLSEFNNGRGVDILSGSVDPVTGLPDPDRDLDFQVTLGDGRSFDVDLAGALSVGDVIQAIDDAAAAAGIATPGEFRVGLASDGNGIQLDDLTGGGGNIEVSSLNNSSAASQLGIQGSASATLTGEDRAKFAVDGVFSHLIALRDALLADDDSGIAFAVDNLEQDITRSTEARAKVGVRAQRVADAMTREDDRKVQDLSLKSSIQDLDFASAAMRFSSLQQQLQASLSTASSVSNLTLLDFLR